MFEETINLSLAPLTLPTLKARLNDGAEGGTEDNRIYLNQRLASKKYVASASIEHGGFLENTGSDKQQESRGDGGNDVLVGSKVEALVDEVTTTATERPVMDTVEQIRADLTVSKALEHAKSGIEQVQSMPGMAEQHVKVVGVANNTMSQIDAFDATYLQPLQTFNTVVNAIANVHPYAKMALGVLVWASQVILAQANRDTSISVLLLKISAFYKFITEDDTLERITSMQEILKDMSEQILECTKFVENYAKTKSFLTSYNSALDRLMQDFRDRVARDTRIIVHDIHITARDTNATVHETNVSVHRMLEHLEQRDDIIELNSMMYASGAGLNTSKKCLQGTRTEILDEIANWINNRDDNTPRVYWLSGQAGMGKSAIAHTIAAWVESLGWLGSCFCFARDCQTERRHEKIFTTIARDLAGRDPLLRRELAGVIVGNPSLKSSSDVARQWEKLIAEPLNGLVAGNVIIVIDALDESGDESTRIQLLEVLASERLKQLPPTVRVFLTSRPSRDICAALENVPHILARTLDGVDAAATQRDIGQYISTKLKEIRSRFDDTEIKQLTEMSDGLFEWARLACEFIKPRKAGVNAKRRFKELVSRTRGQGSALLDEMYCSILGEIVDNSPEAQAMFQSVMRQIL
ncbi:hypothetical protein ID866_10087, partial [Astraeus odoratus]